MARLIDFHTNCHCGKDIHARADVEDDALALTVQVAGLSPVTVQRTELVYEHIPTPEPTPPTTPEDHLQALHDAIHTDAIQLGYVASALGLPEPPQPEGAQTPADDRAPSDSNPTPPEAADERPAPRQPRPRRAQGQGVG